MLSQAVRAACVRREASCHPTGSQLRRPGLQNAGSTPGRQRSGLALTPLPLSLRGACFCSDNCITCQARSQCFSTSGFVPVVTEATITNP